MSENVLHVENVTMQFGGVVAEDHDSHRTVYLPLCSIISDLILQELAKSRSKAIDTLSRFCVGFEDLYPLSFEKYSPLCSDLWVGKIGSV